jgi:hypothetical protein
MAEEAYDMDFPNLRSRGFQKTSEPADYNCIAYAADDETRWWWPGTSEDEYWPVPVPEKITLQTFLDVFATRGYTCTVDMNGEVEEGYEKVAIYALDNGEVTHAAKQQTNGRWRSKLGPDEDIEHTVDGLDGPVYGRIVRFLKRIRKIT